MSWSHTLHLPKSRLANRSNPKLIAQNLNRVTSDLYKWQSSQHDRPVMVLHDGPPYANGELHMGHALNKVLKDFMTRFGVLSGHRVNYLPGWDCHGLPIEHAASKHHKATKKHSSGTGLEDELTALQRRRLARQWAMKMMGHQLRSFQGFGLMANWEDTSQRYLTLDSAYVTRELRVFSRLVEKGLIFRQRKPVFWSVDSGTALAESELVYGDRESTAAYVAYPLQVSPSTSASPSSQLLRYLQGSSGIVARLAVWTTTPWTLVANQAIAVNPDMDYVLVRARGDTGLPLICAADLVDSLVDQGILPRAESEGEGEKLEVLATFKGTELVGMVYNCPLRNKEYPIVAAEHVVNTAGTGLVHTAPGHGKEDYQVGQKNGLPILSPVDSRGRYTDEVSTVPGLVGLDARTQGQKQILDLLESSGALLHTHKLVHSVPLDWRTKTPVMVRATPQFFMDLGDRVRGLALEAIEKVTFKPESAKRRLKAFTESRSDWCISRQRPWGVPIPVLFNKETDEPLMTAEAIDHVINRIDELGDKGLDLWFSEGDEKDLDRWLPPSMQGKGLAKDYRKCQDTLDVWLDSGTSWTMLDETPADFYLEGSDQHRGWFQSSLLLHVAMKGEAQAPFKKLITHGFVLDEQRQKMSKSLGNTVEPQQIVKDIGIDGLRLLIAQSDYTSDISLNSTATQQVAAMIKKFRLTFKYLLGNLNGFKPNTTGTDSQFNSLDLYTLDRLNSLITATQEAYAEQNFQTVVKLVQANMNTELSAIYFDAVKDVLYADPPDSAARQAVQMVLWHILNTYVRILAPILPLLTQEVWDLCPDTITGSRTSPIMSGYPVVINLHGKDTWQAVSEVGTALEIRHFVNDAVEQARSAGHIGSSLACDIHIESSDIKVQQLDPHLLETLYIVSQVHINKTLPVDTHWIYHSESVEASRFNIKVTSVPASLHKCGRCWKYTAPKEDVLCQRCENAVQNSAA